MKALEIGTVGGKPFDLPRDAVTQKLAFLGRTGSGKTYAAGKLAEEMLVAGVQVVILDPVGVHWGLRLAAGGKKAGIKIPVFGGLHGDIPLVPTSGALIADLVVDRRLSVVLDVSQFESDKAKARFVSDFGDRFFRRMKAAPAPVHVFLEESQEFVPQNTMSSEELMLHHWTRLAKLGRNFGIGLSLISQRPQEVNKKVLNMTELLFAFQMTGNQERKTVREWLGSKGAVADTKVEDLLRELPVGHARVSSPQWLRFEGVVQIGKKWTYDSSSTPSFEAGEQARHEPAPLDLVELQEAMAATIEEAEANDPKKLHRRIAELERELRAGAPVETGPTEEEINERIQHEAEALATERVAQAMEAVRTEVRPHLEGLTHVLGNGWVPPAADLKPVRKPERINRPVETLQREKIQQPRAPRNSELRNTESGGLSGPQLRILGALAWLETIGVAPANVVAAAFLPGYRPNGGAFNNTKGSLRSAGLIDYPTPGLVALTDQGRAAAPDVEAPRTRSALHAMVLDRLEGPERRILQPLLSAYPEDLSISELAAASGYEENGGSFNNTKGRLRTLGLIDYPSRGRAVALDLLFPRGLR